MESNFIQYLKQSSGLIEIPSSMDLEVDELLAEKYGLKQKPS